ncbi:MAG: DUF2829 domain-containing protein [Shewanella algae]
MPKFKKKPVVVEAVQYPCEHPALKRCACDGRQGGAYSACGHCGVDFIETLEGNMKVADGDWIITGVNGEHYPCKPDIFEKTYEPYSEKTTGLTFGEALELVKKGYCVSRNGWNGKGQFIYLVKAADIQNALHYGYGEYIGEPTIQPALAIKTATNQIQIGWLASQTDMLANDWVWINEPVSE